ncbi:hypothetical protein D9M68_647560 [compost metagenome]
MRGQRAPGDRARDDAGEIEHVHARQRLRSGGRWRRQWLWRRIADALQRHRRQAVQRGGLRMTVPFAEAAQRGDHQAGVGRGGFEGLGLPLFQRRLHRGLVIGAAQQAQHAVAVMREIGVQPDPAAVAAAVDAGDLVPQLRRGTAVDAQVALAAELGDRVAHVDADLLPAAAASLPQRGGSQRRRGQAGLRSSPHGEA